MVAVSAMRRAWASSASALASACASALASSACARAPSSRSGGVTLTSGGLSATAGAGRSSGPGIRIRSYSLIWIRSPSWMSRLPSTFSPLTRMPVKLFRSSM